MFSPGTPFHAFCNYSPGCLNPIIWGFYEALFIGAQFNPSPYYCKSGLLLFFLANLGGIRNPLITRLVAQIFQLPGFQSNSLTELKTILCQSVHSKVLGVFVNRKSENTPVSLSLISVQLVTYSTLVAPCSSLTGVY